MKLSYYHKALIVAAIGIFYTNVPTYVYDHYGMTFLEAPKHWVLLFCLLSVPVVLRRGTIWNTPKMPVTLWCFGYACLTVLWFFAFPHTDMGWQEVRWRFLTIIEILIFVMIFRDPEAIKLARKMLVAGVLCAVAVNIYELFAPLSFSVVIGRSAGLYENPNMAGEALVLGMILGVTVLKPRYRVPFILITGLGILPTFSRAAVLTWVIAVAGLMLLRKLSVKHIVTSTAVCLILAILILLPRWDQLLTTWERTGVLNMNVQQRLEWFTNPAGVSDLSSWERKYVARLAWEKVAERPVLGSGTGASHQRYVGTHNQYLSFMLDHGLLGVLILPLLILAVTWGARGETRPVALIYGCSILTLSFFSHTIIRTSYSLILLSMMAALTVSSAYRQRKRAKVRDIQQEETAQALVRA